MHVNRSFSNLIGLAVLLALTACGKKQAPPAPPIPEVGVVTLEPRTVPVTIEVPGRTSAWQMAEVRARVNGIVLKREFKEGSEVKAGQRLYKIDPAPYQAEFDRANAGLAKAQANLNAVAAKAERYKPLIAAHAISQQEYDNARAEHGQAAAEVAVTKAALEAARINLGYTEVTSPISGWAGKSQVTPGAYVQASQATLLSTIQQIDPMYVDLTQSSADVLRLRREMAEGQLQMAGRNEVKVDLVLEDGSSYPFQGKLQFSDIAVDPNTGTITLRALFPNPQKALLPGMFVRARVQEGVNNRALVVPQIGITHDAKGQPTALIVAQDNKVALRTLTTMRTADDNWIVSSGLQAGDRVIVQGLQKVRLGMTVKPVAAELSPTSPAAEVAPQPAASDAADTNAE
ncbi:efflux RND transporter periplasmic adaptor subunit [Mycoavidus sp. B2-EB]|uniref:efflux RND transporter periplasmic adaptor subunit n=1 Tax=Mycoavidus sp. B2-EB TaxID=2651972 RepID=UPI001626E09D|nr:efflux RND transporter periplasmic adaptor subunit [Mycoavidus sp. B2-EB]BBO59331.1 hemolysin D [Mycoavidus sp. B2-EB]